MLSTLSGKPVNRKILTRSRKVKSQRSLSRSARIQNQRNSFRLINADGLRGKKILLVDDIVTTDSTVNQAAAELISGDAKNVILAAVARTEGHSRI
jgi:predicted amidophosphoribosyltransferase